MPVIDKLYSIEPEAVPFRCPVDRVALGIPVSHGISYFGHVACLFFAQCLDNCWEQTRMIR